MHLNKKTKVIITAVVLCFAAAGAYAYWTGSGSGSGTAAVGTNGVVTVIATVPDGIQPGTAVPVSFTAANATASPIYLTTVHFVGVTADIGHSTCAVADFTMANVTEGVQIIQGATLQALPTAGSLVYANTAVNQDACKGATLTLSLTTL
jgi:hypothetical protein